MAELPVNDTLFVGALVRDTRLRELTGLSVVGLWERGKLKPAFPTGVRPDAVAVVAGTAAQIAALNALIAREGTTAPVLVIGAGKVGQAAARALKQKGARGPRRSTGRESTRGRRGRGGRGLCRRRRRSAS